MMALLYILYVVLLAVGCVALGVRCCVMALAARRRDREAELVRRTTHLLAMALLDGGCDEVQLPLHRVVGRRRLLAELTAELMTALYGFDPAPMGRVLARYGVAEWLFAHLRHSRRETRARYLRLLADLPPTKEAATEAARYRRDRSREVRFCALLVQLATTPSQALRLIGEFEHPFTAVEVAEVLLLLRRGLLPIAYHPLLNASSSNLRRIGLALVGQFGIEEAESQLLQQLDAEADAAWTERTICVLVAMRRPMRQRRLAACLRGLDATARRRVLRFMAREEYGSEQVRRLVASADYAYYERLVGSYKSSLLCG